MKNSKNTKMAGKYKSEVYLTKPSAKSVRIKQSNLEDMYDFANPKDCRLFLTELRIGGPKGSTINHVVLENGNTRYFDQMDDEEIVLRAREVYSAIVGEPRQ